MSTWRPWPSSSLSDRRVRSLSWLMLAAILPALLFFGHPLQADNDHAHAGNVAGHDSEQDREHARHCHSGMASCADQPLTAGPGQLLASGTLLPAVILGSVQIITPTIVPRDHLSLPGDPPPKSAV